jgi:hypothetical protein
MYAALARAVLDESGAVRAASDVERLRRKHPRASRDELAARVIRRAAFQCAAAGGLLAGPGAFFGAMPFGPDLAYQAMTLNRLVLSLSAIYGARGGGQDRAAGVAAGLAVGLGSELARQGLVRVLRGAFGRRPGIRTAAGALVGGALGYAAAVAVGRFAQDVFRGRRQLLARLAR